MTLPDSAYMQRAIELASHGCGSTSPNPMVGAVIVDGNGKIIGEGYHRRCGEGHAEVNAIASVKERAKLCKATMYVTLEPCSHFGRTPPCAQLIIDTGIPKVVIGSGDPFKKVAGRGIEMLRNAGIEVVEGVLSNECRKLNARFMTAHEQQRPFITLKWAQSSDGFMDSDRPNGSPARFSTPLTSALVHRLRSLHDAIGIGSSTALSDNPHLDCRLWCGKSPQPIIFDRRRRINQECLCMPVTPIILSNYQNISEATSILYKKGITSLLIEGGAELLNTFIDADLWDVIRVETAPFSLASHGRISAPQIKCKNVKSFDLDGNHIDIYSKNPLFHVKNL